MVKKIFFILFILFLSNEFVYTQFFYFGRNKVQYTDFDWRVLKTDHFDIYYYSEMKELAEQGAFFAEESYKALEKKFNHNVLRRIPLIFYSTHLHFQQTNITPGFIPEGVGGFFEFLKGRVVIPYGGSLKEFQHVIQHELVHVFTHSKVNSVLLDHRKANDRLPPLWFIEGLAEFWSDEWNTQADMIMRDAVLSNYIVPLNDMDNIYGTYLMYKEGQMILQYIAEKFGEEKILLLLENFWRETIFEKIFKLTIGLNYEEFDKEWVYAMKKKYYPILSESDQPSAISTKLVDKGFNSKPVFYTCPDSTNAESPIREAYFIGNHTGYSGIYKIDLNDSENKPQLVIEGERTSDLEAFHLLQNKISISKNRVLAFVTKSGENDALHLYDLKEKKTIETLRFTDLVAIGSPSWSPAGNEIVLSAAGKSGSNDLYIWNFENKTLKKLMNDSYDDRDPSWSPDGKKIVFNSDRTPFGKDGIYNLFIYDIQSQMIDYLTYGPHNYYSPVWSPDGKALMFTSDIDGARNIWMMKFLDSNSYPTEMRKITNFTTAAFDPDWADSARILFTAFENYSFQIRTIGNVFNSFDSSNVRVPLNFNILENKWVPNSIVASSETKSLKYVGDYSLDVAQSQISTDPVFGTSGGAFLALSDLLGNEQYYFLIFNTAQEQSELLNSFNFAITRISLTKRTNYAFGIFRFSGRRYDLTDPDYFYFERVFGGYFVLSYPFSKFKRIELMTSASNSEKEIFETLRGRKALFLSNSITFVHDNSLWGPSGPLDGSRFKITFAYTSDIQFSNANYYSFIFDYRYYLRITQQSAYAMRYWLFYNDGQEARRFFMGGNWDLRGYTRWSLRGQKLWLISHELRFPFIDEFTVKFPFIGIRLTGFRAAAFFDAGSAWDKVCQETLGSFGGGLRLNIGGMLVLRYDLGKRIENNFGTFQKGIFHQFFFGWDF
jgi:hypothetical protein